MGDLIVSISTDKLNEQSEQQDLNDNKKTFEVKFKNETLTIDKQVIENEENLKKIISYIQEHQKQILQVEVIDFLELRHIQDHLKVQRQSILGIQFQQESIYKYSKVLFIGRETIQRSYNFKTTQQIQQIYKICFKQRILKVLIVKIQSILIQRYNLIYKKFKIQTQDFSFGNISKKKYFNLQNKKDFILEIDNISFNKKYLLQYQQEQKNLLNQDNSTQLNCYDINNSTEFKCYKINLGGCIQENNKIGIIYLGECLQNENLNAIITHLSLRNTNLQNIENVQSIFSYLRGSKTLLNLDISNCSLTNKEVNQLFSEQLCIKKLDLSENKSITSKGWGKLFRSLLFNRQTVVKTLRLDRCELNEDDFQEINEQYNIFYRDIQKKQSQKIQIDKNFSSLVKFYCNKNTLKQDQNRNSKSVPIQLANIILEFNFSSLKVLSLCDNDLSSQDINDLIGYFKLISKYNDIVLEQLILSNNPRLNQNKYLNELFKHALEKFKNFRKFDISGCKINDKDMSEMIQNYSNFNKSFQQIIIKDNPIGELSYQKIGQHIIFSKESCINKIDFSGNKDFPGIEITNKNFEEFFQMGNKFTEKNEKLEKFSLNQQSKMNDELFINLVSILLFNEEEKFSLNKLSLKNTLTQEKVEKLYQRISQLEKQDIKLLSLRQLNFDNNKINQIESMVKLLEMFLFQNKVCPNIEKISFAYCDLQNQHINQLNSKQKYSKLNLKTLILKGNNKIFEGWNILSQLLFTSGNFKQLESIDLSDCNLEQVKVGYICQNYTKSIQDDNSKNTLDKQVKKDQNDQQDLKDQQNLNNNILPLKILILNDNPNLKSDDWKKLFKDIIFSKNSQIQTLSASNAGFDSNTMQIFIENIRTIKKLQKEDEKRKNNLINLNIGQNDKIDGKIWKNFADVYLLNNDENKNDEQSQSQKENPIQEQSEEQKENPKKKSLEEEFIDVYQQNKNYKEKIKQKHTFYLKTLILKNTSLEKEEWISLFKELIITDRSQIETLDLSKTNIGGWDEISNLINIQYNPLENKKNPLENKKNPLKIKKIMFNDNSQQESTWEQIFSNFFFNTNLLQLEYLSLDNCSIDQKIVIKASNCIKSKLELKELYLSNNNISDLKPLDTDNIDKLETLYVDSQYNPITLEKIPSHIQKTLKKLAIKPDDNNILYQVQSLKEKMNNLVSLTLKYLMLNNQYEKLIEYVCENFNDFKLQNSIIKIDELYKSIAQINSSGKQLSEIEIINCEIDCINQKQEQEKKMYQNNDKELQEWQQIKNNKTQTDQLKTLNLSHTKGSLFYSKDVSDHHIQFYTITYLFENCKNLKNLFLSNCFLSNQMFRVFFVEYEKSEINLDILDLSNNQQIGPDNWIFFFKNILFKFGVFKKLNLSDNEMITLDFFLLYDNFYEVHEKFQIDELYLENNSNNITVKKLLEVYKQYQSKRKSKLKLKNIYGNSEISNIFNIKQQNQQNSQNQSNQSQASDSLQLADELKIRSQYEVIYMWKEALINENCNKIECQNKLSKKFLNSIPHISLDIIEDFLNPLDKLFPNNPIKSNQVSPLIENKPEILCFDYDTIIMMLNYFSNLEKIDFDNYTIHPSILILNGKTKEYFSKPTIFKQIYFISHQNIDAISTKQIYQLYLAFKDTKLDSIIIDYEFKQNELDADITEATIVNLIRFFPPKSLELTNISINGLKAIYSILYENRNFRKSKINFSFKSFINNGIAYSLRESIYMGKKSQNFLIKIYKQFWYSFFNFFCCEEDVYQFHESIPSLNNELNKTRKYFNFMIILTFIYYAICIFCPYFLTVFTGKFDKDVSGVAWESHFVYIGFAFLSFVTEVVIERFAYFKIKEIIESSVYQLDNKTENIDINKSLGIIDCLCNFPKLMKNLFIKFPKQYKSILYIAKLVFSQLDRFDLYSDICFLVICFKAEEYTLGIISLAIMIQQMFTNFYKLFTLIYEVYIRNKKRQLNTQEINQFCELSNLIEFEALNKTLDIVAPYNISQIPNNFILRFILPNAVGQSISNRLLISIQKFLLEDVIQIILQIIYLQRQNKSDYTVSLSILTSTFSILKGLYKFLSIRPSIISQLHFDSLSIQKQKEEKQIKRPLTMLLFDFHQKNQDRLQNENKQSEQNYKEQLWECRNNMFKQLKKKEEPTGLKKIIIQK